MGKPVNCPDFDDVEFKLLLKEMPKAETATADAYKVWLDNGGKYPDHIIEKANPIVNLTDKESVLDDKQILNKQRIIEKSINIIIKKMGRLVSQDVKEEYINEYIKLLSDLKNFEADAAIIEFIKASDRITRSALNTIEEIEASIKDNKNIAYSMKGLYNIKTYVGVFDLLKDIRKDSIKDPDFEAHIPLLQTILDRQGDILNKVEDLSNGIISKDLSENCDIIEKKYKRDAEKLFGTTPQAKNLKGKEKEEAQKEFIDNYILDNKGKILAETRDFVNGLLVRTEDIPYLNSLLTNPKDINNYVLSYAVELLDKADFTVNQRLAEQAKVFSELHKEYTAYMGNKSNMEELYEPLLEKDVEGNLTGYLVNPESGTKFTDLQTKYKDTPVKKLYDELVRLNEEKDKSVTTSSKLGYRLPSINKSFMERIYSENILSSSKEALFDKFRLTSSDTEHGDIDKRLESQKINKKIEVLANEYGEEKQNIPLHYRGKFDPKSQSYDLLTINMLDLANTKNFEEKSYVGIILNLLKENIAEADIIQRDYRGFLKIDKNTQSAVIKKGISSNLYKNLEDLIRHRVYGVSVEGNPQAIKVINTMKSFVGTLNLSLNYLAAGANLSQGLVMEWIESVGGKTGAYGRKNRLNAYMKYNKDLVNMTKDIGSFTPTSKTNLLAEKLQIHRLWNNRDTQFIENNIAKKVGVQGTLRFMDEIGDNHLQSILMYSILDNIKVFDKDGNYLDKDFKPTRDRDKAISYDEAHEIVNGKLVLNPLVASTERTNDINDLKLSKYIKKISRELFGNYDPQNKAIAQRTIIGHLIFQMRGWLIPGIERRWKGVSKVGIKSEDLSLAQLDYSTELGKFEEGHYTTAFRFIATVAKELKSLKTLTVQDNWRKLTNDEKANINKTLLEGALIAGFLLLAVSLKNLNEDDKEKDFGTLLATYYSRRLFSELFTYANPKEGLRTFKSPAVALGTIEDVIDLLEQLGDPTEEYETGKRKGELKIAKKTKDLVPLWKQYDKDIETSLFFLEK